MTIPELSSKDNPLLKTIRLVTSGSRRAPKALVFAEGVRVLEEVTRAGLEIEAVVFSDAFGKISREENLLNRWLAKGLRVYRLRGKLFQSISEVETPQGAAALVKLPEITLDSVSFPGNSLILYVCGIQDPGNLGTLIRTAAAAEADLICTSRGTVSARNPKSVRASAGSLFRIPVVEHIDTDVFRHYCEEHSIRAYRTDSHEGVIYTEADLKSPCAVVVGNEGAGLLERDLRALTAIRIPMAREIESLNVASAGAVVLFEACRQRMNRLTNYE